MQIPIIHFVSLRLFPTRPNLNTSFIISRTKASAQLKKMPTMSPKNTPAIALSDFFGSSQSMNRTRTARVSPPMNITHISFRVSASASEGSAICAVMLTKSAAKMTMIKIARIKCNNIIITPKDI